MLDAGVFSQATYKAEIIKQSDPREEWRSSTSNPGKGGVGSVRKRELSHYLSPGKKLFHIIVRLSDEPGALETILETLGRRVNLVGLTAYTMEDRTAIMSAFAESVSQDERAEVLRGLLLTSSGALDAEVREGVDGILVDTFHSGLETDGEPMVILRRQSLTRMFDQINSVLGTGGEVVLFQEGLALGRANGEAWVGLIGPGRLRANLGYLRRNLYAQGWGDVSAKSLRDGKTSIVIRDCFECADGNVHRTACHFFRGYISGNRSVTYGQGHIVEETRCRFRGDDECEFLVTPEA